jgi:hypothetical protein
MNYRLQCTCGHALYRGAESKEEAVEKFKAAMNQEALDQHWAASHAGEQKPSLADLQSNIASMVTRSDEALGFEIPQLAKA